MDQELLLQIINEAQCRVNDKSLPLDCRVSARLTVNCCVIRADAEGWNLTNEGNEWVYGE